MAQGIIVLGASAVLVDRYVYPLAYRVSEPQPVVVEGFDLPPALLSELSSWTFSPPKAFDVLKGALTYDGTGGTLATATLPAPNEFAGMKVRLVTAPIGSGLLIGTGGMPVNPSGVPSIAPSSTSRSPTSPTGPDLRPTSTAVPPATSTTPMVRKAALHGWAVLVGPGSTIELYRVTDGAFQKVAAEAVDANLSGASLGLLRHGADLSVRLNGRPVLTATSLTGIDRPTSLGVIARTTAARLAQWDNLEILGPGDARASGGQGLGDLKSLSEEELKQLKDLRDAGVGPSTALDPTTDLSDSITTTTVDLSPLRGIDPATAEDLKKLEGVSPEDIEQLKGLSPEELEQLRKTPSSPPAG